jgi:AraC family transcriptional regulator, regulatory protein of adaptative response / methylated-DNA-[protein]-cysteine methyltransferase
MMTDSPLDDGAAWSAVLARDKAADGRFVTGVLTTGIYCRPSCAARHPRRENVLFFPTGAEAAKAGLRPCLRCRPDDVGRDSLAIAAALKLIEDCEGSPSLESIAGEVGYSPFHFLRIFKRATGLTPAAYVRARRAKAMTDSLAANDRVTDAIYDAGYVAPSRFYADAKERLGMTPSAWRDGGRGETIRFVVTDSPLGPLLIAATPKGICRLTFDEDESALKRRFPNAEIKPDDGTILPWVEGALAAIQTPSASPDLPIDVRGTAFQEAVWRELRRIPVGETRSYSDIAAAVGQPGATRAVGTANGSNPVAVLVPCHRVIRSDGSLGGYAGGLDRKKQLLAAEGHREPEPRLPLVE